MTGTEQDSIVCAEVTRHFGGVVALRGVDLSISGGRVTAIIGPNGAGKSTLLNLMCGLDRPTSGSIRLAGTSLKDLAPHDVATRLGMARTFQTPRLFRSLSVLDNVRVAATREVSGSFFQGVITLPRTKERLRKADELAEHWLAFVGLDDRRAVEAGTLSYGEQRRLELARALCTGPRWLLLDEPGAGLNDRERSDLGDLIGRVRRLDISVVLVDHAMDLIMGVSDEIAVLNHGAVLTTGTPAEIQADPAVIEAYLGAGKHA